MPTLPEKAVLVKPFYRNGENAAAGARKFRRLKKQRREPKSERVPRDMMAKFV